jgi:hypothetical protein
MLSVSDWVAVAAVALPLFIKALSDWQANAVANHNAALARIIGMAGREAATIARTLGSVQPGATASDIERSMVQASTQAILNEMGTSANTVGADKDTGKIQSIVQGEVNKIVAPAAVAVGK